MIATAIQRRSVIAAIDTQCGSPHVEPKRAAPRTRAEGEERAVAPASAGTARIYVRSLQSAQPLDVTHQLVSAVASVLWKVHGGNDVLNWIEAEAALHTAMLEYAERFRTAERSGRT